MILRSNDRRWSRREALAGLGAVAGGSVAGCLGDEPGQDSTESNNNQASEEGPTPDYSLQVSLLEERPHYDLTDVEGLLDGYTKQEVADQYSTDVELTILEDGQESELTFEDIDQMHLENEYGQEMASKSELEEYINSEDDGLVLELPEFLVTQGSNVLSVEYDGESFDESLEVTKEVPRKNGVKAEMRRDGEHLHDIMPEHFEDYRTPFRFDTVDRQTHKYQEMMGQKMRNNAMRDVVKKTVENEEHNFRPGVATVRSGFEYSHGNEFFDSNHFSNISPDNLNQIIKDGMLPAYKQLTKEGVSGGASGSSGKFAATAARLADVHINGLDVDENRFDHDLEVDMRAGLHISSRDHGQGVIYFNNRGEWRNLDINGAITVPSEAPDARDESVFYAGNDYEIGSTDNIPYHGKKSGGLSYITNPFAIPDTSGLAIDDNWLNNALKKPRNNERIPEHMEETLKQMMWASRKTSFHDGIIYGGDVNENHLLLNDRKENIEADDDDDIFQAFRKQIEKFTKYRNKNEYRPVTKSEVEEQMLHK